jgi:hypothetical protein
VPHKHICLPFDSEEHYRRCVADLNLFRQHLAKLQATHPELFPTAFTLGYSFHDQYSSRKLKLSLRRIKLKQTGEVFTLRPSFVLPYLVAHTDEIERALYLRQWGVPFEALAYVFGRDAMFWYRACLSLGRANLVGATVKSFEAMPKDLIADEKITWVRGQEVAVATTVGGGCFLGAAVVEKDDTEGLLAGYGQFARQAREVFAQWQPRSVCTDGWKATREAWRLLFPQISLVLCYLHSALKIASRCRGELRQQVLTRVWQAYRADSKRAFSQRLRRLQQWATQQLSGAVSEMVFKLCKRREDFTVAYDCPGAARTSNGVDRLLDRLDRLLYTGCYGHRRVESTQMMVRAMALQWNFHPYGARLRQKQPSRASPFSDLNGFVYHENWLHNLLIASSMGGLRL